MRLISVVVFVLSVAMVRKVKSENFSRCKERSFILSAMQKKKNNLE